MSKIIIKAIVTMFAVALVAGCSLAKVGAPVDAEGVIVQLSVSAGDMQTKAIDESAIQTLRIFAFDQSGNPVGHIYEENPADDEKYHMILTAFGDQGTISVDFYAVANEKAMYHSGSSVILSENMTAEELNDILYSSLVSTYEVLPLYGRLEDKGLVLTSEHHMTEDHAAIVAEPVAITLSRSLAKIGVYAAAVEGTSANPVIQSITFVADGRRDVSYLFPASDLNSLRERDSQVASLKSDRVFDLNADGTDMLSNAGTVIKRLSEQITATDITVTDYYTEILSPFYLAEVPYGSDIWDVAADPSGRPVVLVIKYSLGAGTIEKYATVNMPAIERNAFYQVRCLIKTDGQILVTVSVKPWEAGESWDISFDFPTHSDPLFATNTLNPDETYAPHQYGSEATMYYKNGGEDGAFSVDFNMSYPIGGRWTPTISDASNEDYELVIYERGMTEKINVPITVTDETKEQWYTIKVVPLKSENVGKKATLSISYTPIYTGAEYSYLLQINGGDESSLAWKEKDPDPTDAHEASTVDIVITQVDTY